jgi:hypothetical protein
MKCYEYTDENGNIVTRTVTGNNATTVALEGAARMSIEAGKAAAYAAAGEVGGYFLGRLIGYGISRYLASRAAVKGLSVIGPRATYRQFAEGLGANYLKVTDEAWTWQKNLDFLRGVVARGDDVIFAGKFNPALLDKTSVLASEISYLESYGYKWTSDFTKMVLMK